MSSKQKNDEIEWISMSWYLCVSLFELISIERVLAYSWINLLNLLKIYIIPPFSVNHSHSNRKKKWWKSENVFFVSYDETKGELHAFFFCSWCGVSTNHKPTNDESIHFMQILNPLCGGTKHLCFFLIRATSKCSVETILNRKLLSGLGCTHSYHLNYIMKYKTKTLVEKPQSMYQRHGARCWWIISAHIFHNGLIKISARAQMDEAHGLVVFSNSMHFYFSKTTYIKCWYMSMRSKCWFLPKRCTSSSILKISEMRLQLLLIAGRYNKLSSFFLFSYGKPKVCSTYPYTLEIDRRTDWSRYIQFDVTVHLIQLTKGDVVLFSVS